jgi:glycosyltransferase involved in cell wall biosynthesis
MSAVTDITPLLLTYNEASNIERSLAQLTWARRIVVVDSLSTDDTVAICQRYPQVDLISRPFDDHTTQWNFGLAAVRTPWVLSLDADYVLSHALIKELHGMDLERADAADGYDAHFEYCVFGRPLRASLYPPRVVLFRRDRATYRQDGHTQRLYLTGRTGTLQSPIFHDDRKSIDRWLNDQLRYAGQEARHLLDTPAKDLSRLDRLRRGMVVAPGLVFLYTLLGRGLVFDGWRGWHYTLQRTLAELLLSLRLVDGTLRSALKRT